MHGARYYNSTTDLAIVSLTFTSGAAGGLKTAIKNRLIDRPLPHPPATSAYRVTDPAGF